MNLKYVNDNTLEKMRINIVSNLNRYKSNTPWIDNFIGEPNWSFNSKINIRDIDLHLPQSDTLHFDIENTIKVYDALKHLTIIQAIDERLWVYLTHEIFWNYMRKRWPIESYLSNEKPEDSIKQRYFFMSNKSRALVRNGIARLWWYGYVSYDETREDHFELTRFLLSKADIAQNLLERTFSKNKNVTKAVLSVLLEEKKIYDNSINREQFRSLMKYLNQLGGVTILDALEQSDLEKIIKKKLDILN
ncbi:DUF6339 family protein [Paenibacillus sp. PK4536]|uniref:DUF6339 family protein n=1 Tax=Paenibacillus sp. PK4536 TaxID=3024576 RepID=UPI002359E310|nr:DUF6339 family protein [Paenibacillus sp. PK4536]WIM41139.1 DUF6339 family protein [Paenibacillus sp. PK4536]